MRTVTAVLGYGLEWPLGRRSGGLQSRPQFVAGLAWVQVCRML